MLTVPVKVPPAWQVAFPQVFSFGGAGTACGRVRRVELGAGQAEDKGHETKEDVGFFHEKFERF